MGDALPVRPGARSPRGDAPTPSTLISLETAFRASYPAARYGPNDAPEWIRPRPSPCGRQNVFRFGSLPTM